MFSTQRSYTPAHYGKSGGVDGHTGSCHRVDSSVQNQAGLIVMIEEVPTSFSPFSLADCTLFSHFSFNDFVAVAFMDLAGDLDIQI